jgi:hypothetical protein
MTRRSVPRIYVAYVVLACCGCADSVRSDEVRVHEVKEVRAALDAFHEELVSEWLVVSDTPAWVYIASAPRVVEGGETFCVRDVIRLARQEGGPIGSISEQIDSSLRMVGEQHAAMFQMYANVSDTKACRTVEQGSFFRVQSRNGAVGRGFFGILEALIHRDWTLPGSKYSMEFADEVAKQCLALDEPLKILGAEEDVGTLEKRLFLVHLGGCVESEHAFILDVFVEQSRTDASVRATAASVSEAAVNCIREGCAFEVN